MATVEPQQLARVVVELAATLRDRRRVAAVRNVVLDLEAAAELLRALPDDAFRQLPAERRAELDDVARIMHSLLGQLQIPAAGSRPLGLMLGWAAAEVQRLYVTVARFWPAPGGPGILPPRIEVRCPRDGCGQTDYKRTHSEPAPLCPDHGVPMT